MQTLTIRYAIPADAPALHLLNESFNGPGEASCEQVRAALSSPGGEITAIAYLDDTPAGFCCAQVTRSLCYRAPMGELTELYVAPAFRHQGIARRLIAHAEAALITRGVSTIRILTGADNTKSQALYKTLGYTPTDEILYEKAP